MLTVEQLWEKYDEDNDFFGFTLSALVPFLPYKFVKEQLKPETLAADWNATVVSLTRENVLMRMKSYMEFAWDKATGHRGISAGRSVDKFKAWLMMLEDTELLSFIDEEGSYTNYGAPTLLKICEKYDFEIPEGAAARNMASGKKCWVGCEDGCG